MYTPQDNFEAVRYGQLYGNQLGASRRDLRRNGRQFRRYLKTDAADWDRSMYEASEKARIQDEMDATATAGVQQLQGAFAQANPIAVKGPMSEDEILAQEAASDARRQELYTQDLNNRIAGAARFGDAFRTARQAGLNEFTWRGNRYGTELAQPSTSRSIAGTTPRLSDDEVRDWASRQTFDRRDWVALTDEDRQRINEERMRAHRARSAGQQLSSAGAGTASNGRWDGRTALREASGIVMDNAPVVGTLRAAGRMIEHPSKRTVKEFAQSRLADLAPVPVQAYRTTKGLYQGAKHLWDSLPDYRYGGRLNRFQEGGAMPQQDIMSQIQALVQAAAQGDEQATQQITQIMEAAKAGDQQAAQIAQMIQQVIQQMQGQATAAKWGAKLNYMQSLKYKKGGKAKRKCQATKHDDGGRLGEFKPIAKAKEYVTEVANALAPAARVFAPAITAGAAILNKRSRIPNESQTNNQPDSMTFDEWNARFRKKNPRPYHAFGVEETPQEREWEEFYERSKKAAGF